MAEKLCFEHVARGHNPEPKPNTSGAGQFWGSPRVERIILAGQIRGQVSVCRAWNALPNNVEHNVEAIMEPTTNWERQVQADMIFVKKKLHVHPFGPKILHKKCVNRDNGTFTTN